jgi:flagellar biosynthetic protein FliQ
MAVAEVLELGRNAIITGLILCAPILLAGLVVGVVISIILAATQIQEFTLTFIPKILAMALAAFICGPWMVRMMMSYTLQIMEKMAKAGP